MVEVTIFLPEMSNKRLCSQINELMSDLLINNIHHFGKQISREMTFEVFPVKK